MAEQENIIVDYFIVGAGLAGICFVEVALQNGKTALVFDGCKEPSSKVAAGVYNGVTLKRFTLVSEALEQINLLKRFYLAIENKIKTKVIFDIPTYRVLSSIEEQNNFIVASDRPLLQDFLSSEIIFKKFNSVSSPFGFGQMKQTGFVNTSLLLSSYKDYIENKGWLIKEDFSHSELVCHKNFVEYKGRKARHIVFCEGYMMNNNPFFQELPLDGAKGELLVIKSKELNIDVLLKAGVFVLPIGNGFYKVGATYNWTDKTDIPTEEAKKELISQLKRFTNCDFEIIEHLAGVRPTVKDRKPLVGRHHQHKNMYLLNGLGTRGVMLAPYLSKELFNFIEFDVSLKKEINIERIYKKSIKT